MPRECYLFKKDGKCKFGDSCRYRHVKRENAAPGRKPDKICQAFTSKDGCKGNCNKAHAFKEDKELLEMYANGVDIINIRVNEIDKIKRQIELTLKLGEKDMYELPTPSDTASISSSQDIGTHNPPSLTFNSFLGASNNSRYKHESHAASCVSYPPKNNSNISNLDSGLQSLKMTDSGLRGDEYVREVQQVERLYRNRCQVLKNSSGSMFQLLMKPTDPDWNLTFMEINLDVFIPVEYPSKNITVEFYDERVSMSTLESINSAIADEINERLGTMCVRPMLRWIDRNIGEMLQPETQFHTHSSLKIYKKGEIEWSPSEESDFSQDDQIPGTATGNQNGSEDFLDKDQGTSIRLIDLDLHGSSHGLVPKNILFLLQCLRCKCQTELLVPTNTTKVIPCYRCSCELSCRLYKKLCLPSSSSIACVDLIGCSVSDALLSRCQINSICTECSNSTFLSLVTGQMNNTWCSNCAHKMSVAFEGLKIVVINPPAVNGKQKKRKKEDKGYVEGQPLPDKGTCKHYKKSQRWFRFSCCGRLFPCDRCHDEMVPECPLEQANRMVCGLCAKEQPMRSQCKFCHSEISGTIKSAHWEGGKGCRDKKKMSVNDSRKHKNSNKTHCQKDKRVGQQKKKDNSEN